MNKNELNKLIEKITKDILDTHDVEEATSSVNVSGFDGKYGFSKRGFGKKKKGIMGNYTSNEGGHKNPAILGYTLVESQQRVATLIKELKESDKPAFKEFFKSAMEKFSISSPNELQNEDEKQSFYDYVDRNFKAQNENRAEDAAYDVAEKFVAKHYPLGTEIGGYSLKPNGNIHILVYGKKLKDDMELTISKDGKIVRPQKTVFHSKNESPDEGQQQNMIESKYKGMVAADVIDKIVSGMQGVGDVSTPSASKSKYKDGYLIFHDGDQADKIISRLKKFGIKGVKNGSNYVEVSGDQMVESITEANTIKLSDFIKRVKSSPGYNNNSKKAITAMEKFIKEKGDISIDPEHMLKHLGESVLNEASDDKLYFEKFGGGRIQMWRAYAQGSGNTLQIKHPMYITDKSGDSKYNRDTSTIIDLARKQYKTIRKAQNTTLHKIPAYDYKSNRPVGGAWHGESNYDIHGGDIKPSGYEYLAASSGPTKVVTFFQSQSEGLNWMKSMVKESINETKFIAFYNGKKHEIEASSQYAAKVKAIEQLKIPKSKQGVLSVKSQASMDAQDFKFETKSISEAKYSDQTGLKTALMKKPEFGNLLNNKTRSFILKNETKAFLANGISFVFTDGKQEVVANIKKPMTIVKPLGNARAEIKKLYVSNDTNESLTEVNFKSRDEVIQALIKDFGKKAASFNNNEKTQSNEKFWTLNRLTKHYHDLNRKNESMNEVLGYRLSNVDKFIIKQFVLGYFDDVKQAVARNKSYSLRSTSSKHVLSQYSPVAVWQNGKLLIGDTFGNVTQTIQNYATKMARRYDIPYKIDRSVQNESAKTMDKSYGGTFKHSHRVGQSWYSREKKKIKSKGYEVTMHSDINNQVDPSLDLIYKKGKHVATMDIRNGILYTDADIQSIEKKTFEQLSEIIKIGTAVTVKGEKFKVIKINDGEAIIKSLERKKQMTIPIKKMTPKSGTFKITDVGSGKVTTKKMSVESIDETNTSLNPSSSTIKQAIEKASDGGKVKFFVKDIGMVGIDDLKSKHISGIEKIVWGESLGEGKPFNILLKLTEGRNGAYYQLSKDETMSTRQKMGMGIRKMNEMLGQIETLIKLHSRLKTETDFDSQKYWKRAQKAMIKIETRLVRISNSIKQLK